MKTILVPTDFSLPAENAARYAMHLAQITGAGIKLFNAVLIPAAAPMASQVAWPLYDFDEACNCSSKEMIELIERLKATEMEGTYNRPVDCEVTTGMAGEMLATTAVKDRACMVVMGMSGAGSIEHFFLGSTSQYMIANSRVPLLLIPKNYKFKKIERIAIATDLNKKETDLIQSVASLARYFNADVLLCHVTDDKYEEEHEQEIHAFLREVSNTVNYDKIYYRHIKSMDVDHGLEWLAEHGMIDMVCVVHRKHGFWANLFGRSHTKHLAEHIDMPLLVFPPEEQRLFVPHF